MKNQGILWIRPVFGLALPLPRGGEPDAIILRIRTGWSASGTPGPRPCSATGPPRWKGESRPDHPEALRARHNEGFRRVMATGESRYAADLLAVPGLRKTGRISLEFTITLIKDDEGTVLGAVAIMRDVTIRWQRAREMKTRLAALGWTGRIGLILRQGFPDEKTPPARLCAWAPSSTGALIPEMGA